MRKLSTHELHRLTVEGFQAAEKLPLVVVLDDVRSLSNVGSIFRTADVFLVEKIYLCGITGTPPHREIQKTALGSTESVAWEYAEAILPLLGQLRQEGYSLVAFEQTDGGLFLPGAELPFQKAALIFGNEVQGVQQAVLDAVDYAVEIPQYGTKHSLNIAVAAGIGLFDFAQRALALRLPRGTA